MRVEIKLAVVVSLRPKGAAFGQAGSTRLDSTRRLLEMVLRIQKFLFRSVGS